jgi:hypothetical protein
MEMDSIWGGKGADPDEELFAGGAVGLTTDELTLTPDVPAAFVAVDENV